MYDFLQQQHWLTAGNKVVKSRGNAGVAGPGQVQKRAGVLVVGSEGRMRWRRLGVGTLSPTGTAARVHAKLHITTLRYLSS